MAVVQLVEWSLLTTVIRSSNPVISKISGNPGLVVMGDDSCSRGRGFESRSRILYVHMYHQLCSTSMENKGKEAHLKNYTSVKMS